MSNRMDMLSILVNGELCIGENRINEYLSTLHLQGNKVSCNCEDSNHLRLRIETKSQGTLRLLVQIEDFQHDSTSSSVRFKLLERRLEGNSLKAMLFEHLHSSVLKYLLELFALPKTIEIYNNGDIYTVNFHRFLIQSPIAEERIMGVCVMDCIRITGANVDAGQFRVSGTVDFRG